jgi:hypothetical protein
MVSKAFFYRSSAVSMPAIHLTNPTTANPIAATANTPHLPVNAFKIVCHTT